MKGEFGMTLRADLRKGGRIVLAGLALLNLIPLTGCGSAGGTSAFANSNPVRTGRVSLKITWSDRSAQSRLIPVAANSIVVTFTQGGQTAATQVLSRPASGNQTSANFNSLPLGDMTVTAQAHPNADGSGVAQASASSIVTIQAGQVTPVDITMASTIDHLEITPTDPSVQVSSTTPLAASAKDANGSIVLTSISKITWSSQNTAVANVSTTGVVTGVSQGTSLITAAETESGKQASVTVSVTAGGGGGGGGTTPAHIYIADTGNNRIVRIDDMNGSGWVTLGRSDQFPGSNTGEFWGPTGLTVDSQNRILVADSDNHRLARFNDMSGSGWQVFGTAGTGQGQLQFIRDVATDFSNRIYIACFGRTNIVRIDDMSGAGWTTYGQLGTGTGQFVAPVGIQYGPDNRIYVADTTAGRVMRFNDMNGTGWQAIGGDGGTNQFSFPDKAFVDKQGRVYVADNFNHRIVRFNDFSGTGWTTFGSSGSGTGQLNGPTSVFVTDDFKIYIVDQGNHRIVKIDDMTGAGWKTFGVQGSGIGQLQSPTGIFLK
jgi:hypothetical protein